MKEETRSKIKEWCISFIVTLIGIAGFFGCCYLIAKFGLLNIVLVLLVLLVLYLLVLMVHSWLYDE